MWHGEIIDEVRKNKKYLQFNLLVRHVSLSDTLQTISQNSKENAIQPVKKD